MTWSSWVQFTLCFILGLWLVFDGARAIVTGDYTTPSSGDHRGQLGPWADVVRTLGLEPRSVLMKVAHLIVGALNILGALSLVSKAPWSTWVLILASIGALWYTPFGTVIGVITLALTIWLRLAS